MFLAAEATRTFTGPEFLLALFQAVAFVVMIIWVKLVLYRRRIAEDKEANRHRRQRETHHARVLSHPAMRGMAESTGPPRSAVSRRALRKRERKMRKRLNRVPAKTNGLQFGARECRSNPPMQLTLSQRQTYE